MDKHIDALLELRLGCQFDSAWSQQASEQVAALDAAIALMRGQSEVPFGMVLMPVDPTPEMLARYEHVRSGGDWQPNVFRLTKRQLARHRKAYAAMLPDPPKDSADEQ